SLICQRCSTSWSDCGGSCYVLLLSSKSSSATTLGWGIQPHCALSGYSLQLHP
ncbi:hypothetical protein NDU88_001322, partial [Pleurodeles waltl]